MLNFKLVCGGEIASLKLLHFLFTIAFEIQMYKFKL